MVFEFNGAPPALLGSAATSKAPAFATFATFNSAAPSPSSISTTNFPVHVAARAARSDKQAPTSSEFAFGAHSQSRNDALPSLESKPDAQASSPSRNDALHSPDFALGVQAWVDEEMANYLSREVPTIERSHPRVVAVVRDLITQLESQEITHEEGAHVLGNVVVDERFLGSTQQELFFFVLDTLGVEMFDSSVEGSIARRVYLILRQTWQYLRDAEINYEKDVRRLGQAGELALLDSRRANIAVPPFITAPAHKSMVVHPLRRLNTLEENKKSRVPLTSLNHSNCESLREQLQQHASPGLLLLLEHFPMLAEILTTNDTLEIDKQAAPQPTPFRFLDLPAEMRNRVYQALLAPANIKINIQERDHVTRAAVDSQCHPSILATCKQINREAKDIITAENTICATVIIRDHTRPIFNKGLLPDRVLPKLNSLLLMVDCSRMAPLIDVRHIKEVVHWKQLQDMTSLKTIRICFLDREEDIGDLHLPYIADSRKAIVTQIIERIPKTCEVSFEAREGWEDDYVQYAAYLEETDHPNSDGLIEVDREMLEPLFTADLKARQGCKSGHTRDYRFADRVMGRGLTELSKGGGKFMLGQ